MLSTIYYVLAGMAYAIFLIQFIVSMFGGDLDIDSDIDADASADTDYENAFNLSWSDIFSFKGFIHFLMGFAGWLSLAQYTREINAFDYIIALVLGFGFIVILLGVSRLLYKFRHEPGGKKPEDLVGDKAVVCIICNNGIPENNLYGYYVILTDDANGQDIKVYSPNPNFKIGDEVYIVKYENKKYFI